MHPLHTFLTFIAFWALANAAFKCNNQSRSIMVQDALTEQAQYGSASELVVQLKQPWPLKTVRGVQYRLIEYCYHSESMRRHFHCTIVQPALYHWANALGGGPSAQSGHNLAFREATDRSPEHKVQYCLSWSNNAWDWNPDVSPDVLWLQYDSGDPDAAMATVGYNALSTMAGRHQLTLGKNADVIDVVHEFGHVFGMMHEAMRSDRDDYVRYECRNVVGYGDCLERAMVAEGLTEQEASTKLCEDADFAAEYEFLGTEFIKTPRGHIYNDGSFDLDSVMLYRSNAGGNDGCIRYDVDCPLFRYKEPGNKNSELQVIPENKWPSAGDAAWVKKWYPWIDQMQTDPQAESATSLSSSRATPSSSTRHQA